MVQRSLCMRKAPVRSPASPLIFFFHYIFFPLQHSCLFLSAESNKLPKQMNGNRPVLFQKSRSLYAKAVCISPRAVCLALSASGRLHHTFHILLISEHESFEDGVLSFAQNYTQLIYNNSLHHCYLFFLVIYFHQ